MFSIYFHPSSYSLPTTQPGWGPQVSRSAAHMHEYFNITGKLCFHITNYWNMFHL